LHSAPAGQLHYKSKGRVSEVAKSRDYEQQRFFHDHKGNLDIAYLVLAKDFKIR
jgi:hypothetical protein